MHTKISIFWDDEDPFRMGRRIDEAFNRVINFCPELLSKETKEKKPTQLTAFNRVISGEFDRHDLTVLHKYAVVVHGAIVLKYGSSQDPLAESIVQAAVNLITVVTETVAYVEANLWR